MSVLDLISELIDTSLRSDLLKVYSSREPGRNVDEINLWLKRVARANKSLDSASEERQKALAAIKGQQFENLPVGLKRKAILIESEVRAVASNARVSQAVEEGKQQFSRDLALQLKFANVLRVLASKGKAQLYKEIKALNRKLTEAELEQFVSNLGTLAKLNKWSEVYSPIQLSELQAAAELGLTDWPESHRKFLFDLNSQVFESVLSEASERERELRRLKSIEDLANRSEHDQRFQAIREAMTAAAEERKAKLDAERAAERAREEARELELELEREKREAERQTLKQLLAEELRHDFKSFVTKHIRSIDHDGVHREVIAEHIQNWAGQNLGSRLDMDQALAVASVFDHTQVVARAGSGKTLTLAVRLCFLLIDQKRPPHQVLALAFNKDAQEEIKLRVQRFLIYNHELQIGGAESAKRLFAALLESKEETKKAVDARGIALPVIMTFHGLAHQLIAANLLKDAPKQIEGDNGESNELLDTVTRELLHSPKGAERLRQLLRQYFNDDLHRLTEAEMDPEKLFEVRKHLPFETLRGEMVKSHGERQIANWLFTHGVGYYYESATWTDDRYVYPDFTLALADRAVIEYTGMAGDFDYDKDLNSKREAYRVRGYSLLELVPGDIADGRILEKKLKEFLRSQRIDEFRLLSKEEIWQAIRNRIVGNLEGSRFNRALAQFVNRAQREGFTPDQIRREVELRSSVDPIGLEFARIAADILEEYTKRLGKNSQIDQTQALSLAIDLLGQNKLTVRVNGRQASVSELSHISVDEHQDFSSQFESILKLLQAKSGAQVFAVGDDWQCINRFAGSEPELFHNFVASWTDSILLEMPNNYRSRPEIVRAGNEVMRVTGGTPGAPTKPPGGLVSLYLVDKTDPRKKEAQISGDLTLRVLRRLLIAELSKSQEHEITILTRTRTPAWNWKGRGPENQERRDFESLINRLIPGLSPEVRSRIKMSTVHSFKGLQSDTVIVTDVQSKSFPLIHADNRFQSFFGESLESLYEDERRLLYVALTRPIERLYVLTRSGVVSPFLTRGILSHEQNIKTLSSGYQIKVSSKDPFDDSYKTLLEKAGFSIYASRRPQKTAHKDITSFVLNSGGAARAKTMLMNEPPIWLRKSAEYGCRFEIEEIFGDRPE